MKTTISFNAMIIMLLGIGMVVGGLTGQPLHKQIIKLMQNKVKIIQTVEAV